MRKARGRGPERMAAPGFDRGPARGSDATLRAFQLPSRISQPASHSHDGPRSDGAAAGAGMTCPRGRAFPKAAAAPQTLS